jgi:hypothetical protein
LEEKTMKWRSLFFFFAVIGFLGACESPTVPRYPDAEDDTTEEDPKQPSTQGFILSVEGLYFV